MDAASKLCEMFDDSKQMYHRNNDKDNKQLIYIYMKLFNFTLLLFQSEHLEPVPSKISRYLYAKNYGPTVGDKVKFNIL